MQLDGAETGNSPGSSRGLAGPNAAGALDEAATSNFDVKDAVT